MLKAYYTNVSDFPVDGEGLPLSDYRIEKLSSCRNMQLRKQYIGAELLLLWALKQENYEPGRLSILCIPGGKPVLKDSPLFFSLSHSGSLAGCAISDRIVGMDLEREGRYHESLLRRCFSPDEQRAIRESENPDATFTFLWTGKESILKYHEKGIYDDMSLVHPLFPDPWLQLWRTYISGEDAGGKNDNSDGNDRKRGYYLSVCFDKTVTEFERFSFVPPQALLDLCSKNGSE